ncbi:DUF968 domain-containing protein [Pararhizobium sp.]|uniref:DUF968 domain-containing protein n=1 Tax=Pararhizobium sp. TaxID=1977563 RepID=UPI002724FBEA|nr:DUF968 domain-containing protein [Pararhizobium sp.]MDO9416984.1 DUF968 domain-containing protein [Pararhizobium sp.]
MGFRIAHHVSPDPTPKAKAKKSAGYLSFLHQLPCVVTGVYGVEAAHVSFASPKNGHYGRGKGTKAGDRWALPLSSEAHRAQHATNEADWWAKTGIDPHLLALRLHGLFTELGDDAEPFATAIINQTRASP